MARTLMIAVASAALAVTIGCAQAQAPTVPHLSILHGFGSGNDGQNPFAGLIAHQGVLYGTTQSGGASGNGTVFKLTPPAIGQTHWTEKVLYSFAGGSDGYLPNVLIAYQGALYGTTTFGGASNQGTVFKLTPPAIGQTKWTETIVHNFVGGSDGQEPFAGLIAYQAALYGTTSRGGSAYSGTVFKLTPPANSGGTWTETVVYSFLGGGDGNISYATLTADQGALYGTTYGGGTGSSVGCPGGSGCGTVFKLTPPANSGGTWTETVLYSFVAGSDGQYPQAGLIVYNGALYGTTQYGGSGASGGCDNFAFGCGTVFKLTPPANSGGQWTETIVHNFAGGITDGFSPYASLIVYNGALYGTTAYGGIGGSGVCPLTCGTVFKLTPPAIGQTQWTEKVVHSFAGPNNDGEGPYAALTVDQGALYGTTNVGGLFNAGTVFKLTP
jgi:uncharacterized repeat protein (TIGR03803 family)